MNALASPGAIWREKPGKTRCQQTSALQCLGRGIASGGVRFSSESDGLSTHLRRTAATRSSCHTSERSRHLHFRPKIQFRAIYESDADVIGDYTGALASRVHDIADAVRNFVPAKAHENMTEDEIQQLSQYIQRSVDLLLMEVDEEVKEFVATLKDWPLDWLVQDGRVLLNLTGAPAGEYYGQQVIRFFRVDKQTGSRDTRNKSSKLGAAAASGGDDELEVLPRHSLVPGDMVLLTDNSSGPLVDGSWYEGIMYGVVTERSRTWIKVAFESGPTRDELNLTDTWRLDQAVNTLTTERALLALVALWNQLPFSTDTWSWKSVIHSLFGSSTAKQDTAAGNKEQVEDFYELLNDRLQQRLHLGVFEGCSLSGVIVRAEKGYDWHSLPAEAGGMPDSAIYEARRALPYAGRPDEQKMAAMLRGLEQQGRLSASQGFKLDMSQMYAIATAVLNPLTLLHGPPGTGKTTTIGALLFYLRRRFKYNGSILAAAQSNVAVDNMLETAMRRGGLKVLRIGEPVKVRSCLQKFTLRAALDEATQQNDEIKAARREQQHLRQQLRRAKQRKGTYLSGFERRKMYERLDELTALIKAETASVTRRLLAEADVVGVTCTGAAGPELADVAFDMVVIDEGSQASEPEALIPLMKGCRRAVLVGDHKQLPPVIKSRTAADAGLSKSLFERLMELGAPSAMLQVQYRSHPGLMSFINKQYYHGLLSNGVSAADRPAPAGFSSFLNSSTPLVFIAVEGREKANARGSKLNEVEADVIERLVLLLTQQCDLLPGDLGVISPYAAQVSLLSKNLSARGFTINSRGGQAVEDEEGVLSRELEIKSVDGYQGREKEVILLSTVRANMQQQTGFLDDWRRANVALSRARRALVVVGHRGTLRGSSTWKAFLEHTAQQGCLVKLEQLKMLKRVA